MTTRSTTAQAIRWSVTLLVCTGLTTAAADPDNHRVGEGLAVQVALDRAGISAGLIDGRVGARTRDALTLFQRTRGLPETGTADAATLAALGVHEKQATVAYTLTAEDVAGPFVEIPSDMMQQGALPSLGYTSAAELIAERFHTDATTLRRLNPSAGFREDDVLQVPAVEPMRAPAETQRRDGPGAQASAVQAIVVSVQPPVAVVIGTGGDLLFAAPVTSGSDHDPLPLGEWKVLDVYLNPVFHYNPALFWDADPSHAQAVLKPGPNNPVGLAWIDIDREHYGLHGTPEPRTVGHTTSHGCVRLTNWDVVRLLDFVRPGTRVLFDERLPAIKPTAR